MQALAHPVDGAVPRFEQFGVGQSLFAAAENFGLLRGSQFAVIFVLTEPGAAMFLKPMGKPLPFLGSEGEDGRFKLFQAHGRECICGGTGCKPAVREAESWKWSLVTPAATRNGGDSTSAIVIDHVAAKGFVRQIGFRELREIFQAKMALARDGFIGVDGCGVGEGLDAFLDPFGNGLVLAPRGFLNVTGEVVVNVYRERCNSRTFADAVASGNFGNAPFAAHPSTDTTIKGSVLTIDNPVLSTVDCWS